VLTELRRMGAATATETEVAFESKRFATLPDTTSLIPPLNLLLLLASLPNLQRLSLKKCTQLVTLPEGPYM
jgi:hypothetical protein